MIEPLSVRDHGVPCPPDPMAAECQGIVANLARDTQLWATPPPRNPEVLLDLAAIDERVTYAPKAGVKCLECGATFDAVKCPSCGAVDHSHPLVRFGEQVGAKPEVRT